jgi:peptide/nickel transport system permease protein
MTTIPDDLQPSLAESEPIADPADDGGATRAQIRKEQRRVLFRSPGFVIGVLVLLFWTLAALFPDLLSEWGQKDFVTNGDGEPLVREGPSSDAWFGTDKVGRDVYARVIYGARPVLIVAPLAAAIAVVAGTLIGLLIGYYRGAVDEIVSRVIEGFLSIPSILMAILVAFTFGASRPVIIGTIAVLFTPTVTRTIRAATLAEAQLDYVTSAKMRGERGLFIISREILPNILGVMVVELTVRLGYAVFTVATLAFLGITAGNLTNADWGVDVSESYDLIGRDIWWPTVFPAMAIASLVISVNLIADSIEKATSS